MSLKAKALSGVRWNGLSMATVALLQFIALAVLARLLSPSDFGLMGITMVVIGFARLFSDMGVSSAIVHRQDVTHETLSSLYWLNVVVGLALFSLTCICTPLLVLLFQEPRLANLVYVASLVFVIAPFGQQFQVLLQKELRFACLAKTEVLAYLVNAMVAVALAVSGKGVFSLVWGQIAGTTIRMFLLLYWGWKDWRPSWHFSRLDLSGYVSFGLYQMGEKVANFFNRNLDYLLIGSLLGAKALGYYTLAYSVVLRPSSMINPVITRVAFPVFSRIQADTARLKHGYLRLLQMLSSVNFPVMAGLAVVAPVAVPIIFGNQWLPSVMLIQILAVVGLLRSIGNPIGSLLLAKGRADLSFKWNLAVIIAQLPGLFVGAKYGGAVGVAIAFAILMGVYTALSYPVLIRKLLGPCLMEYVTTMWPSLWMSLAMGSAVLFLMIVLQGLPSQLLLSMLILTGIGVYAALTISRQRLFVLEMKQMLWPSGDSA